METTIKITFDNGEEKCVFKNVGESSYNKILKFAKNELKTAKEKMNLSEDDLGDEED